VHGLLTTAAPQCLECRTVVCAVPITQLQNSSIEFAPPLPAPKQAALQRVRMGTAVKVFGVFAEAFWPAGMWDVVCAHQPLPEIWMTRYPVEDVGHVGADVHCVTAFCTGDRARHLSALAAPEAVALLLKQLNDMFGTPADPRPAQRAFVRGYVRDWSKAPFIGGAYTHPTLGAKVGDRDLIAANVGGAVFFAGEHAQLDMNPCLQGAMETGVRAAVEALHALKQPRSAL